MYLITIDETKCDKCAECVAICPQEIYKKEGNLIIVGPTDDCTFCQSCISVCGPQAITITEV